MIVEYQVWGLNENGGPANIIMAQYPLEAIEAWLALTHAAPRPTKVCTVAVGEVAKTWQVTVNVQVELVETKCPTCGSRVREGGGMAVSG